MSAQPLHIIILVIMLFISNSLLAETLIFSGIKGSLNTDISMQVLNEAYRKLGINVKLQALPAERSLQTSNAGKVDGEVFRIANVHKRYNNLIMIPTSINKLEGVAFVKNKSLNIDGWQSLSSYNVGGQYGVKFVERGAAGMNVYMVETNDQLFTMLDNNRIDVAVCAYVNGIKTIKDLKLDTIKPLKPSIQDYPLYHYLHKKHAALAPRIERVLMEMQQSGRIAKIRNDYIEAFIK